MATLKIRLDKGRGKKARVSRETMVILIEMAQHRDTCDDCGKAFRGENAAHCATGRGLVERLTERPDVSVEV